ncbi:MFS transporter [Candidatus Bathyarchaeota archaeon]|nr:MFS transporter [Candidatus Bathyarchaeota archaeon]
MFIVTYVTYASYYLTRLNYSIAVPSISMDLQLSRFILGLIGGAFSIAYATGQFLNGPIIDSFGAKRAVLLGLVLTSTLSLIFSYSSLPLLLMIVWCLNGYAQSLGWPSVVRIISNWFRSGRWRVGGAFGSCFLVGNMIAWPLLGYVAAKYGWRAAFYLPPILLILMAVIFYLCVEESPRDAERDEIVGMRFRFKGILSSRNLILASLAYVMIQIVRSGFTLWIPSYLFESWNLPLDMVGCAAAAIPIGGILGSATLIFILDRMEGSRRRLIVSLLTLSLGLTIMLIRGLSSSNIHVGIVLLLILGLTLYTPHIIISTVIPMEYGCSYGVASVAGFIDGMGYVGSTFANPFVGWILDVYGWDGAIIFWLTSSLLASLLIGLSYRDAATENLNQTRNDRSESEF